MDASIVPTQRTHFYFDAEWRLLEERIDPGYAQGPNSPWDWNGPNFETAFNPARQTDRQYIWDPTGGPNELVQVRTAPTAGTLSFAGSLWAATDRHSSVIAWVPRAADTGAYDRVHFRAFGTPIFMPSGDANGDGVTDFSDYNGPILANWGQTIATNGSAVAGFSRIDADQNGSIAFGDYLNGVLPNWGATQIIGSVGGAVAAAGTNSGPVIGYAGAIWDPDASLCLMRYRWYDPALGRFLSRDPAGYTDGSSLYLYALGNPLAYFDPMGLQACDPFDIVKYAQRKKIGERDSNSDLLTPAEIESGEKWENSLVDDLQETGKEFLKDAAKAGIFAASIVLPGPDEIIVGALLAKSGWTIRAGKLVDKAGREISEKMFKEAVARERKLLTDLPSPGANAPRGWRPGDPINNLTPDGSVPSWSTVRERYWKNRAGDAKPGEFSKESLERMNTGQAPMDFNPETGKYQPRELHHDPAQREGGRFRFIEVTPDVHKAIDPHRK